MIRDSTLVGSRYPRRQLPTGMLPLLLEAARRGSSEFTIAVCDQLAPSRASNSHVLHYASIPSCIRAVCYHCPPVDGVPPVVTMEPDEADRSVHHPDTIKEQWRAAINESWPSWQGVAFTAIDRNDFYDLLPSSDVVVHTLSEEPYANVLLRVNPSQSPSLRGIPKEISPLLAQELSMAGHSNAIAIVPRSMEHSLRGCSERALKLTSPSSAQHFAAVLSQLWLPDTHVQHPAKPLQTPLGVLIGDSTNLAKACATLGPAWQEPSFVQVLSPEGWQREIQDTRLIAAVITDDTTSKIDCCYLMKNWISGYDGGF